MAVKEKAVKNSSPQNPNTLGFSENLWKQISEIELPENLDPENAVKIFGETYQKLTNLDPGFELLQWSYSRMARLKGTMLNRLYHIKSELREDSLLTREQYTKFREHYCPESDDTIENFKNVAFRFPLSNTEADDMSVSEMIRSIRGKNLLDKIGKNKNPKGSTTDTGDQGEEEEEETKTPRQKPPFSVNDIKDKIIGFHDDIVEFVQQIPAAQDLLDNTHKSESLLGEAEGLLTKFDISKQVKKLREALEAARKKVEAHKKRRIKVQQPKDEVAA